MEITDWRTALRGVGDDAIDIDLYVEPGGSRQAVGPYDPWRQRVKVKVVAPATAGKANKEVAQLLGDLFGVAPSDIRIRRGSTTRRKTIGIAGVSVEAAIKALAPVLGGEGESPG